MSIIFITIALKSPEITAQDAEDLIEKYSKGSEGEKSDLKNLALSLGIQTATAGLGALEKNMLKDYSDLELAAHRALYGRGEGPIRDLVNLGRDRLNLFTGISNSAYKNTGALNSNQALANAYSSIDFGAFSPVKRQSFGLGVTSVLKAAGLGAASGAAFGGIGALVGGIGGALAKGLSLIGSGGAADRADFLTQQAKRNSLNSYATQVNNTNRQMGYNAMRNLGVPSITGYSNLTALGGALDIMSNNLYNLNNYITAMNRNKMTSLPNSFLKTTFPSLNLFSLGGDMEYNEFNAGGTHEENPNGGVLQGFDSLGIPNTVEEGEVKVKTPNGDYIYSNELKVPKELCKLLKVPVDSTYAEAAKIRRKEYDERPNDDIARRGWEWADNMLRESLELQKQEMVIKEVGISGNKGSKISGINPYTLQQMANEQLMAQLANMDMYSMNPELALQMADLQQLSNMVSNPYADATLYAYGGYVNLFWAGGNPINPPYPGYELKIEYAPPGAFSNPNTDNSTTVPISLFPPIISVVETPPMGDSGEDHDNGEEEEDGKNKNKSSLLEIAKYAPIFGLALNLSTPEDYSMPNRLLQEISVLPRIDAPKLTNYMTYKPTDLLRYTNLLNALNAAARNAVMNTTNPSRNAALASLAHNANISYGDMVQALEAQNAKEKMAVLEYNANIDLVNALNLMNAAQLNQGYDQMRIQGLMQELAMRDAIQTGRANAIQSNLQGLTDNLYNIYRDDVYSDQFNIWQAGLAVPVNWGMRIANGETPELIISDMVSSGKDRSYIMDSLSGKVKDANGNLVDVESILNNLGVK